MPIKNISDRRRLPRIGKIRLGIKKVSQGGKEYPAETDYFVVPKEVSAIYGDQPKELDIMFPLDDRDQIAKQHYEYYGGGAGLKCRGDGEDCTRLDEKTGEMQELEICPCDLLEQGKCKPVLHLFFILPKVAIGGVYQISTSSINSIQDINSGLDFIQAIKNTVAMIPLKLRRQPYETHHDGKKQTHYTLQVCLPGRIPDFGGPVAAIKGKGVGAAERPALNVPPPESATYPNVSVAPDNPADHPKEATERLPENELTLIHAKDALEADLLASGRTGKMVEIFMQACVAEAKKPEGQWTIADYENARKWLQNCVDSAWKITMHGNQPMFKKIHIKTE